MIALLQRKKLNAILRQKRQIGYFSRYVGFIARVIEQRHMLLKVVS